MRRLIMWNLTTLDGFFEGAPWDLDWQRDLPRRRMRLLELAAAGVGRRPPAVRAGPGPCEGHAVSPAAGNDGALGKVVWSATMSLDGFIAGPGDTMGWVFDHSGPNPVVDQVMRDTGAVLAGRRSYDVGLRAERPELEETFGGGWSGTQFVLTHRSHDPDPANTFLSGDIRDAVALALRRPRART